MLEASAHASVGYAQKNDRRRPARLSPPSWTLPQLLAGRDRMDVFKKDGLVDELKKALWEWILKQRLASIWMASIEGKNNHATAILRSPL